MRIAIDAQGGDFGIAPNIAGAIKASVELGHEIILVGDEQKIEQEVRKHKRRGKISIVHAPSIIDMSADPAKECKNKPDSSIMVAAGLVKSNQAEGFISAGNSGATMVASLLNIGRIKGISRPAIAVPLPTLNGFSLLLDAGANTDCKAEHLAQFALMGSIYSEIIFEKKTPTIGLLSVGEEESKGNALIKETIPYMKKADFNYFGTIEGRDIPQGITDVVVCDGFVGNVALKLVEGMGKTLIDMIKIEITKNPISLLGGLLAKSAFKKVKAKTDPDTLGGAPLLGINGSVIIAHGKSNEKAIFNAIKAAGKLAKHQANEKIKTAVDKFNQSLYFEEK
ncbi:MAG: phosphate acyltransferase PlsX [Elusimicrobiaceae bacterium]|nr:phosphate acyltransferase PlsX [Elusimicrobiaceae bacterium]MBT3955389.1 phosphate acyltransferase PlsX [Elusimicrobiaceae bacterium]MBT4007666.1 phosphate acyltransferase PlsX [Elusimicrobiaceae bacterium]MBT4402324.1 phosphate acyltransferase PlsX [Elusimicrobiaceae bacterium]MBT4439557.1 phosphate acyltransferase PlsX [Elusimicrobiaceae bacterium]